MSTKPEGSKSDEDAENPSGPLAAFKAQPLKPVDLWGRHRKAGPIPASLERNKFRYKSLSSWAYNIAMGCNHACRFCYVPGSSANKHEDELKRYGVGDPDAEWGDYVLLRAWDEVKFRASLERAQKTPEAKLNGDGNRAVIFCSTTDPYQTIKADGDLPRQKLLNGLRQTLVRRALEIILNESDLNVRILTRSPLAKTDFDLYRKFGNRLVFGMSLPTLNDNLCKLYEPKAPGPRKRLEVLQQAKQEGLHVYVAMAPTSPECQEEDLEQTLEAIKKLDPITIFHEPINLRAENVPRIVLHAEKLKVQFDRRPLLKDNWPACALWQLHEVERIGKRLKLTQLHLWPDKDLGKRPVWNQARRTINQPTNDAAFAEHLDWLKRWWDRVSEWPKR